MNVEKRVLRQVGEAVFRNPMIEEGDSILIAVSGGKDSTALALALARIGVRVTILLCFERKGGERKIW